LHEPRATSEQVRDAGGKAANPLLDALRWMFTARAGDEREGILLRQGKGWLHVSGAGHEALGGLAYHLRPADVIFPHYRDRALMLARGMSTEQLARDYFARAGSSSAGRNIPSHYSSGQLNVVSIASPTGSQCLPAVGCAWGITLSAKGTLKHPEHNYQGEGDPSPVVVCCLGDAATRQGEFYEAVCFAVQEHLPIVFVVEDNGYGISTRTQRLLPFRLGIFAEDRVSRVNGRDIADVLECGGRAITKARIGGGPSILWCELDRLSSHTSSDDHRVYRTAEEIESLGVADPIPRLVQRLVKSGELTPNDWAAMQANVRRAVDVAYQRVEAEPKPDATSLGEHLFGPTIEHVSLPSPPEGAPKVGSARRGVTMIAAVNHTFGAALERFPSLLMFGEDIEDPKGGVFGFTAGLSSRFPGRVVNSPLAEGTIVGVGAGLAAAGYRPVFEIQFIDFIGPGLNQLITQATTLRWRSKGEWACPLVLYAPYGAYLPAGGMWHSQSNDGWWAHTPGLRVAIPSCPEDAAGLFWAAFQDEDPTLILIPKHLCRVRMPTQRLDAIPFGRAAVRRVGDDVTLVSWGNGMELAEKAAQRMAVEGVAVEVIDLRTLVPCDWGLIERSLQKTGRLVVVHEDNRTCGFGQAVIAEMITPPERFDLLLSPPQLVARPDIHIPFCPDLEYALLPDLDRVVRAIRVTLE
jgi:2-oxoisovalerate dehydrogenase E1 component